ncbi:hypothetical protein SAMN04488074_10122 [Lentzea albidocapillata subsp. violacea]|uniref:PPE family protein n=1 Tax=Lentzea albidocapillata subsp. violacea TaxID=128104 RepID=A0A1G8PFZ6_9PSEU|nr:hypothetical protein [Lentzea albidocapillata]SDI91454.1 hypothetical protein SAMN04488074_10122 [Lentzea albidocapillata subsp. violacea]
MSPGEINWEAYSHEELHRMLWQDADVADVSTVADEWTRHRAALDAHAEVLREQRAALLDGWAGAAAEEAAARLGALAERIGKISELAAAGQKAAQDSADALAAARAAMPPPPSPGTTMPAFAGLPSAPGSFALPSAPGSFAPAPFALPGAPGSFAPAPFALPSAPAPMALPSAPTMPAGATSGFYFYFGAASADQQKAQAVRAMQTYESSLNGSGRLIEDARSNVPQAAPTPRAAAVAQVKTPSSGGVPWQRLVGGSVATATRGPVVGGATPVSQQLTPGMRAGVMFGQHGGIAAGGTLTADARTSGQNNAMGASPAGAARKDEDQEHENQMPTLDHDLFAVTERVSPAVIGEEQ